MLWVYERSSAAVTKAKNHSLASAQFKNPPIQFDFQTSFSNIMVHCSSEDIQLIF